MRFLRLLISNSHLVLTDLLAFHGLGHDARVERVAAHLVVLDRVHIEAVVVDLVIVVTVALVTRSLASSFPNLLLGQFVKSLTCTWWGLDDAGEESLRDFIEVFSVFHLLL